MPTRGANSLKANNRNSRTAEVGLVRDPSFRMDRSFRCGMLLTSNGNNSQQTQCRGGYKVSRESAVEVLGQLFCSLHLPALVTALGRLQFLLELAANAFERAIFLRSSAGTKGVVLVL